MEVTVNHRSVEDQIRRRVVELCEADEPDWRQVAAEALDGLENRRRWDAQERRTGS